MVGGPLLEGTFQDRFNFMEALFLGGDAGVISIDEAKALWGVAVGHWCRR